MPHFHRDRGAGPAETRRPSVGSARLESVAARPERPEVPDAWVHRLDAIITRFPETTRERAWVGVCWRVKRAPIAHVFGGEDQLIRITFRADPQEVLAFQHLGPPYFRAAWGVNVVGLLLDRSTDWDEM